LEDKKDRQNRDEQGGDRNDRNMEKEGIGIEKRTTIKGKGRWYNRWDIESTGERKRSREWEMGYDKVVIG